MADDDHISSPSGDPFNDFKLPLDRFPAADMIEKNIALRIDVSESTNNKPRAFSRAITSAMARGSLVSRLPI